MFHDPKETGLLNFLLIITLNYLCFCLSHLKIRFHWKFNFFFSIGNKPLVYAKKWAQNSRMLFTLGHDTRIFHSFQSIGLFYVMHNICSKKIYCIQSLYEKTKLTFISQVMRTKHKIKMQWLVRILNASGLLLIGGDYSTSECWLMVIGVKWHHTRKNYSQVLWLA